ncbi:hypothetical protein WA026_009916 [Henosepilachna vigintioctopunctata]|uniref:DRBM domain-containing protein n=1 Tax=Henosepilachna vigintioctopunctata TaxID=420089 RepID=A0AAW1TRJ2_9CUCU
MAINKTPISMLQELMVAMHAPLPTYYFSSVGNLLQPKFSCTVYAASFHVTVEAGNKKDAKQLAAKSALKKLGYEVSDDVGKSSPNNFNINFPTVSQRENFLENRNYIGELHELASGSGCTYPEYEIPIFAENGLFQCTCKFQDEQTFGYNRTKKQAKQIASYEMLLLLKSGKIKLVAHPHPKQSSVTPHHANSLIDFNEKDMEVLKKFKELSLTKNQGKSGPPHSESYPDIKKGVILSMEEAEGQLKKYNIKYEIKVLQREPFVVMVNLSDKRMTLLGGGLTKIEATTKALNSTLEILQEGCSLIFV